MHVAWMLHVHYVFMVQCPLAGAIRHVQWAEQGSRFAPCSTTSNCSYGHHPAHPSTASRASHPLRTPPVAKPLGGTMNASCMCTMHVAYFENTYSIHATRSRHRGRLRTCVRCTNILYVYAIRRQSTASQPGRPGHLWPLSPTQPPACTIRKQYFVGECVHAKRSLPMHTVL